MLVWFPEEIRYDRSLGTVEFICPGCRERVVADVHEKLKAKNSVGRCRLCGFFAELPDTMAFSKADSQQFLAVDEHPPKVPQFVALAGSPYEVDRAGGVFEFTRERALLAAIAIALKWHRPRVFWSRTIFAIIAAFVLGFVLVAVAVVSGLPWLAFIVMAGFFIGVFLLHRRLVRLRTLAETKERVLRFLRHYQVSQQQLVQAGLRDGGDFKMAAQFLSSYFCDSGGRTTTKG
jgi:hypothetical protein